jgi:hypothetical protein
MPTRLGEVDHAVVGRKPHIALQGELEPEPHRAPCIDAIMGVGTPQGPTRRDPSASRIREAGGAVPNSLRSAPAEKWSPSAEHDDAHVGIDDDCGEHLALARRGLPRRKH